MNGATLVGADFLNACPKHGPRVVIIQTAEGWVARRGSERGSGVSPSEALSDLLDRAAEVERQTLLQREIDRADAHLLEGWDE